MPTEPTMSLRQAVVQAIVQEMRQDPAIFYIGEDVGEAEGVFKQTEGLHREFGAERVIDTPISEAGMMGIATGAAMAGARPIIEIMFGDFLTLVMDQLVNHAAKIHFMSGGGFRVPLVLRTGIGVGGVLGPTHSQTLYAWPAHVPGLKVVAPSNPADAKGLMASAIRDNNPVLYFEDRMTYNSKAPVPPGEHLVPLGRADIKRPGRDLSLIAFSRMVPVALEAARQLEQSGISAEVIDPRTIAPLDAETLIESVARTGRALVVDGGHALYGIAGEVAATVAEGAFDYLDAPVLRIGAPHYPVPCSKTLEAAMVPSPEQIVQAVQSWRIES